MVSFRNGARLAGLRYGLVDPDAVLDFRTREWYAMLYRYPCTGLGCVLKHRRFTDQSTGTRPPSGYLNGKTN